MQQESLNINSTPVRISRDEMNLAEFPLTVLSTRADPSIKTLEFSDTIRSKTGEMVTRHWIITGADKFGLPTSSDDEVLLGLLKLTVDHGFENRKVFFTRYELLKVLQWTTEGRSYTRLQKALDRLTGVRIKATNAFFDNSTKAHSTRNFGLIDAYEINDGKKNNIPSFFIWSEVLFNSFQAGFIKKLDLSFFISLQSAVSKRIYRYLDKHFWYKSQVKINLFTFAHEKIGVSRSYKYISSLKQQIDPACDELVKRGFLGSYQYSGYGSETEIIFNAARKKPKNLDTENNRFETSEKNNDLDDQINTKEQNSNELESSFQRIKQALVQRGLKANQVDRLLADSDLNTLDRVSRIIEHFDQLVNAKSRLVSLSPVGFLYRAVEKPHEFKLQEDLASKQEQYSFNSNRPNQSSEKNELYKNKPSLSLQDQQKIKFLAQRKKQIDELRQEVEPNLIQKLEKESCQAMSKLKDSMSPVRFKESIDFAVDEKLANLFKLPSFKEWLGEQM